MFNKFRSVSASFKSSSNSAYHLKRTAGSAVSFAIRLAFIIGFCYQFLFPIFYMVVTAFQSPNSIDPSVIWIPKKLSFSGIRGAFENLDYLNSAGLTLTITVLGTIFELLSCSLVGYGFARFDFRFKNTVFLLVIVTIIVPPQALIMSNYVHYRYFDFAGILKMFGVSVNLLGTPWVFVLPSIFASGLRGGLFIFIFRQFFTDLPKELEEAAEIDGCGQFKTFIRIMVPMAKSSYITVLLFSVVWHWNEYYSSSTYFTGDVRPLSVRLLLLKDALEQTGTIASQTNLMIGRMYMMGGVVLTIAPLLILYIFTQRFFTESIERTGIVG